MRAISACTAALAIGCAATSAPAAITILKANGSPASVAQATKTYNPKTNGWTIVVSDLYDIGGWSTYNIHGNAGEIIDEIVIDIPCWMVNGNCQPAGSPAVVNVYSDPPLGISTIKSIVQTGTAETILSDVTVEQDLGSVDVEAIGILRAGRDVTGPIHARTGDNQNRGITKLEAQRDILGDVTADNGRITLVVAYGSIGTAQNPVTIRAKHDIIQVAGFVNVYADINTRYNGGAGRLFAFGTPNFHGRLETEQLFTNPYSGLPGRILVTESMDATIVVGKSFTNPTQWMQVPEGGLQGQIIINADNVPGGAWTSPIYIGDEEADNRVTLTGDGYTLPAAALGGGSVGLAPFRLHEASCAPLSGATVSASPDMSVTLHHYGPVSTSGAAPISIERRTLGSAGGWAPVSLSDFTIAVAAEPNALRVTAAPGQSGFAGGFEYRIMPTVQLRSDVASLPGVIWTNPYVISVEDDAPLCPADTNLDGTVDALDLLYVLSRWATSDPIADLDGSGTVDALDFLVMIAVWGGC